MHTLKPITQKRLEVGATIELRDSKTNDVVGTIYRRRYDYAISFRVWFCASFGAEKNLKSAIVEVNKMYEDEMISFGAMARELLGQQCQYASRHIETIGKDLRITGEKDNYHSYRIHKDDVITFVERWVVANENVRFATLTELGQQILAKKSF